MNNLQLLRDLNKIKSTFSTNEYGLSTISELVSLIRRYRLDLSNKHVNDLLAIPINILDEDVELINNSNFIMFGSYFSGNIRPFNEEEFLKFKKTFESHEHTLDDMRQFTKLVGKKVKLDNEMKLRSELEFLLRNTEVVIRDDVKLKSYSSFMESGEIFSKCIDKVIDEIIGKSNEVSTDKLESERKYKESLDETYDIALSFAGEDREYASDLANKLKDRDIRVFYDYYEIDNLWGKDLYEYLSKIYKDQAKYCIMFLSVNYANKLWTNHERKSAQARAFTEQQEYILPIRLDDTSIPGINNTIGYIEYKNHTVDDIADMIKKKLEKQI